MYAILAYDQMRPALVPFPSRKAASNGERGIGKKKKLACVLCFALLCFALLCLLARHYPVLSIPKHVLLRTSYVGNETRLSFCEQSVRSHSYRAHMHIDN